MTNTEVLVVFLVVLFAVPLIGVIVKLGLGDDQNDRFKSDMQRADREVDAVIKWELAKIAGSRRISTISPDTFAVRSYHEGTQEYELVEQYKARKLAQERERYGLTEEGGDSADH